MDRLLFFVAVIIAPIAGAVIEAGNDCMLVQPVNTSSCGVKGDSHITGPCDQPQIVSSLDECAALCERRVYRPGDSQSGSYYSVSADYDSLSWCKSFQFDTKTNFCQLSLNRIEDYVHKREDGRYVFYNSGCYDCGYFCTFAPNLLDNGGFEGRDLGPWVSRGGRIARGYHSRRSYYCPQGVGCVLDQLFNMCNGHQYIFDFDFKIGKPPAEGVDSSLYASIGGTQYQYLRFVRTAQPWKSVRGFVRATATVDGRNAELSHKGPSFLFKNSADMYLDNVRVARVGEIVEVHGPKSLFVNGGFESGQIAPWKVARPGLSPTFEIVSPGLSSQYALQYSTNEPREHSPAISQVLVTKPNAAYLFRFEVGVTGVRYLLTAVFGGRDEYSVQEKFIHPGNHGFAILFSAQTNNSKFTITLAPQNTEPVNGTITVDNFELIEVKVTPYT